MSHLAQPSVISSIRVKPEAASTEPIVTELSIIDSTVVTFAAAAGLWVFDASRDVTEEPSAAPFLDSLATILSQYPQFAGELSLTPYPTPGCKHKRFRRAVVRYGFETDPGVSFEVARYPVPAAEIFPDPASRATSTRMMQDMNTYPIALFQNSGPMPVNDLEHTADTPAMCIRMTIFSCHSIALAVRIAHPLSDAQTLVNFMRAWGSKHQEIFCPVSASTRTDLPPPIFNPLLVDACASGDINGAEADRQLLARSWELPLPRFDWWAHERGNPAMFDKSPKVIIPSEIPLDLLAARRSGNRLPWEEWDMVAPVSRHILHLTAGEIEWLYQQVRACALPEQPRVSRHDVLMAFIWQLIAAVRPPGSWPFPTTSTAPTVFFDMTLGLRDRLGLPASFVGSPILLAALELPHATVAGTTQASKVASVATKNREPSTAAPFPNLDALAATAAAVRGHILAFDHVSLGAWLHEQAFELAPQRWWNGFLGPRHVFGTSWVRTGIWLVDFGLNSTSKGEYAATDGYNGAVSCLRWAGPVMPALDGLVTFTEAWPGAKIEDSSTGPSGWRTNGVDVDTHLEVEAMKRTLDLLESWKHTFHS